MAQHTLNQAALNDLVNAIEHDISGGQYDGAVVLVAHHGEIALHKAIGHSDRSNNRKTQLDDVFHLMSTTKQLTTVVVLQSIERGQLSLKTKIAEIIPELGVKVKKILPSITCLHI